ADEMALALCEAGLPVATQMELAGWVRSIAKDSLDARAAKVAEIERSSGVTSRHSAELVAKLRAAGKPEEEIDSLVDTLRPRHPAGAPATGESATAMLAMAVPPPAQVPARLPPPPPAPPFMMAPDEAPTLQAPVPAVPGGPWGPGGPGVAEMTGPMQALR